MDGALPYGATGTWLAPLHGHVPLSMVRSVAARACVPETWSLWAVYGRASERKHCLVCGLSKPAAAALTPLAHVSACCIFNTHSFEIISPWRMCPDPCLVHCVERVSKMLELWLHKMVHVVLVCGAAPQRRDACSNQVLCFDSLYAWTNYDDPRRPLPPNLTLLLKQVRKHCICWWSRVEPRPNNAAVAKTKHAVALTRNSTARHSTPACWLHRHKFDVENERGTAWYAWG